MNPTIKKAIKPFYKFLFNIGIDPRSIFSLRHYPKYLTQYKEFQKLGGKITHKYAIFTDYDDQAGSASGHYFHQDLLVASYINKSNPMRHIDIGSRIDGFIAHVASFRKIDVMDVRDLSSTGHSNISFIKADLMNKDSAQKNITDSISCLHAIEHFGLGRYGDRVDPEGHIKGFNNIIRMLKPDGTLYISFPIGKSNEIHFNAHRVFHPKDIFSWAEKKDSLKLERFDYVDDAGKLHQNININININIDNIKIDVIFGCGIYTFKKIY
jgi:SAM-dependent methyltransferase